MAGRIVFMFVTRNRSHLGQWQTHTDMSGSLWCRGWFLTHGGVPKPGAFAAGKGSFRNGECHGERGQRVS